MTKLVPARCVRNRDAQFPISVCESEALFSFISSAESSGETGGASRGLLLES